MLLGKNHCKLLDRITLKNKTLKFTLSGINMNMKWIWEQFASLSILRSNITLQRTDEQIFPEEKKFFDELIFLGEKFGLGRCNKI